MIYGPKFYNPDIKKSVDVNGKRYYIDTLENLLDIIQTLGGYDLAKLVLEVLGDVEDEIDGRAEDLFINRIDPYSAAFQDVRANYESEIPKLIDYIRKSRRINKDYLVQELNELRKDVRNILEGELF